MKKQDEKRYSLIAAPKRVVAMELGKIRNSMENPFMVLSSLEDELGLSFDEIIRLESGDISSISSSAILKYFNYVNASMQSLYDSEKYSVFIPKVKGYRDLGKKTYWMAIDAYTTRFASKDELLDDIRENGYLDIEDYDNDDLWVFIEYPRKSNHDVIDLVYRDNEYLTDFIDNNDLAYMFSAGNPYVSRFNTEVKEFFRSHINSRASLDPEYRIFLKRFDYGRYYTPSLLRARNWDLRYDEDIVIWPVCLYSNIRGNAIIRECYKKRKASIERSMIPFNDPDNSYVSALRPLKMPKGSMKVSHDLYSKVITEENGQMQIPFTYSKKRKA